MREKGRRMSGRKHDYGRVGYGNGESGWDCQGVASRDRRRSRIEEGIGWA